MTLPCFHISLNLGVAEEVELQTALAQEIPVLDLVRGGSGTVSAALCQAMGLAEDMNSVGENWILGQRCKTGPVRGGTRITGWVAFAHGKACTGIQLHALCF